MTFPPPLLRHSRFRLGAFASVKLPNINLPAQSACNYTDSKARLRLVLAGVLMTLHRRFNGEGLAKFSFQERAEPMNKSAAFQGARDHGNIR